MKKTIFFFFILFFPLIISAQEKVLPILDFTGGLSTKFDALTIQENESPDLLNVEFESKLLKKRKGSLRISSIYKNVITTSTITTQSDFSAGETLTNIDTSTSAGTICIAFDESSVKTYGTDATGDGTPTVSSQVSPLYYSASKAFDNDNNTYWLAESGTPQWIKYDFGSETKIVRLTVVSENFEDTFIVQGSNNDSDWTSIDTINLIIEASTETRTLTFTNVNSYRYYRMYFTYHSGAANIHYR